VSQITYKQGSATRMTTSKTYDYLNRLTQISSAPAAAYTQPLTFNYGYNPANQRIKDTLADGTYWIYGYDSLGQVTNGVKYFSNGTPMAGQQFDYAFDTIGNRTRTLAGGDQNGANLRTNNYYANNLNQITNRDVSGYVDVMGASDLPFTNVVTVNGQTAYRNQEYFRQQVPVNNGSSALWTNMTVSGGQTVSGHVYVPEEPEHFSYDADGNLTNDGRWAYVWDGENRLSQMTVNTNVGPQYQLNFAYDYKGRQIQKAVTIGGTPVYTNDFLYDGWNLIAEVTLSDSLIRGYVWGADLSGSLQGAGGVGGLLELSYYGTSTTNCFAACDGNGNVMGLANAADGTIAAYYDYGPFGEPIRINGAMGLINPLRFSTKYDDDESDLLYYGYRYYKPTIGTWLSRDPLRENGGVNLYLFINNDGLDDVDKNGLMSITRVMKDINPCDHYKLKYNLSLDYQPVENGFIVQHLDIEQGSLNCSGNFVLQKTWNFWEAMRYVITTNPNTWQVGDINGAIFKKLVPGTGLILYHRDVNFFWESDTGDLDKLWADNHIPGMNTGPISLVPPVWWNKGQETYAYNAFGIDYHCCCGNSSYTFFDTAPSSYSGF
jgi:RHS repeat-associated protein